MGTLSKRMMIITNSVHFHCSTDACVITEESGRLEHTQAGAGAHYRGRVSLQTAGVFVCMKQKEKQLTFV